MGASTISRVVFPAMCLVLVISFASADLQNVVIYETDFSENPGWITNSPSRYYWDGSRGMYHFKTEGGTNAYAYVPVQYDGQSFTLDYDVVILVSQPNSAFRFGLTSMEMDFTRGTTVLSAFENGKFGRLFSLRVIDQNNQMREVSSYYASYCGDMAGCNTVEFKENTTYHVTVRYNRDLRNADIKIVRKDTGEVVFGYFVPVARELLYMNRIAITTKGDYFSGPFTEGYIDNVRLEILAAVTPTQSPTPSLTSTPTTGVTSPTTVPPTTLPTTTATATATATALPAMLPLVALAAAGLAARAVAGRRA
ncbi:MAG: hypothetical protein QFX32_01305 [Methanolinea sp.]|nr:hypothetical protein [Methanolinea sp.]